MARICQRCDHHNEDHAKFCLSCGGMLEVAAEAEQSDPLIGKVLLGRYRPISVLGEGGMGKVYLAEQKMGTATRKVAIKTLHPELGNDPQLVARFHRESETVIELRHPNTIQFYDFGELDGGELIIVMEYIEGNPLAKVIEDGGAIDPARADKIIIQICGSLHEAHQRGVVHRDLKPENILLTDQGGQSDFVKVLDFGIAKKDDAEDPNQAKLTKQGMVLGTPPYMSPEQFSGQSLDLRSDVYSLGVMVYEMVTGKLPFEAATPWEWATKHLTAEPTPLEAHAAGVNLAQNKKIAIMRALAKNRDDRPDSVLTFLREFTGYEDTDSAWTRATSTGGPPPPSGAGVARPAAPTPGPMQAQAGWNQAATPPPGYPGQPSQPGMGSQPGFAGSQPGYGSQPGVGTQPGHPSHAGMASAPGFVPTGAIQQSHPGQPSYPGYSTGYSTGSQPASGGGSAIGMIVLGVLLLFGFVGGALGLGVYAMSDGDDDDGPDTVASDDNSTGNPTSNDNVGTAPADPNNPLMVPSSPNDPMQPMQPGTLTPPVPTPPAPVEPTPPTPPTPVEATPDPPSRPRRRGPTPAQEARARGLVASGMGAARRNDFAAATASLRQAQRAVGRNHPITRELSGELSRRGSNQVGILLQQGNCGGAQRLYRDLNRVGAGGGARRQFGDWCPPR